MVDTGYAEGSVDRWAGVLMSALHLAEQNRRVPFVPKVHYFHPENTREGFLEPGFAPVMLDSLKPEVISDFFWMFYCLGIRPINLEHMYWSEPDPRPRHSYSFVDRERGLLWIPRASRSKNKKPNVIALVGKAEEIIERRWQKRTEGGVISNRVFHVKGERIWQNSRFRAWDVARKALGRPDLIPYDLRRSFTRDADDADVHQRVTMKIQGHTKRQTSDGYNARNLDDVSRALLAVEEYRKHRQGETPKVVAMRGERL